VRLPGGAVDRRRVCPGRRWSPDEKKVARRIFDLAASNAKREILDRHRSKVIDTIDALWQYELDRGISAVVAAETFSDLQTVVTERAPFFFTPGTIGRAIKLAEQEGHFEMVAANPALAAQRITTPVLLIHGAADSATLPDHSRRVFAALAGPKRLILVPGAGHNGSLRGNTWEDVERWLDEVLGITPG